MLLPSTTRVAFTQELTNLGFLVLNMEPGDEADLFRELGRLFRFPDYYGGSGWDAVNDCFVDVEVPRRTALVWRQADTFSLRDPKAFGEACHMLSGLFECAEASGIQAVLVLTGIGPSFSQPT